MGLFHERLQSSKHLGQCIITMIYRIIIYLFNIEYSKENRISELFLMEYCLRKHSKIKWKIEARF